MKSLLCSAIILITLACPSLHQIPNQPQPVFIPPQSRPQHAAPHLPIPNPDIDKVSEECCRRGKEATRCDPQGYQFVNHLTNDYNMYCRQAWSDCCKKREESDACGKGMDVARQGGDCQNTPLDTNPNKRAGISCCMACQAGLQNPDNCTPNEGTTLSDRTYRQCCQEKAASLQALTKPSEAQPTASELESEQQNDHSRDKTEVTPMVRQEANVTTGSEIDVKASESDHIAIVKPDTSADDAGVSDHETAASLLCPPHQVMDSVTKKCVGTLPSLPLLST